MTWAATNTSTSRDRLRCRAPWMTRGIPGALVPAAVATPSRTLAVSNRRAMTPVARVAYQSGLTVVVTAQEEPDDVTGAAGVLDGGCGGGASCELTPLGWLVAAADAGPERDGVGWVPERDGAGWVPERDGVAAG